MGLSSSSTRSNVVDAIKDNLRYAANDSVSQAQDLIEAIDHYLFFYAPKRVSGGSADGEVELDTVRLSEIRDHARRFLQGAKARAGSGGGRYFDLSEMRD